MKKTLICLTLCFALFPNVLGQGAKFDHSVKFKTAYDKFDDRTNISLARQSMDAKSGVLELQAFFNHPGKKLTAPASVVGLAFYSSSPKWKYLEDHQQQLTILSDEHRFRYAASRMPAITNYGVAERLVFVVPVEDMRQILLSNIVEIKLGPDSFALKNQHLESLRDLVSRMSP